MLRRGGKSNLAFLGLKPLEDADGLRRRWSVKGVPSSWGPADFLKVIEPKSFGLLGTSPLQTTKGVFGPLKGFGLVLFTTLVRSWRLVTLNSS